MRWGLTGNILQEASAPRPTGTWRFALQAVGRKPQRHSSLSFFLTFFCGKEIICLGFVPWKLSLISEEIHIVQHICSFRVRLWIAPTQILCVFFYVWGKSIDNFQIKGNEKEIKWIEISQGRLGLPSHIWMSYKENIYYIYYILYYNNVIKNKILLGLTRCASAL